MGYRGPLILSRLDESTNTIMKEKCSSGVVVSNCCNHCSFNHGTCCCIILAQRLNGSSCFNLAEYWLNWLKFGSFGSNLRGVLGAQQLAQALIGCDIVCHTCAWISAQALEGIVLYSTPFHAIVRSPTSHNMGAIKHA